MLLRFSLVFRSAFFIIRKAAVLVINPFGFYTVGFYNIFAVFRLSFGFFALGILFTFHSRFLVLFFGGGIHCQIGVA